MYVIYIPGLGDEQEPKGQLWAVARWPKHGVKAELFRMRWGDKEPWQPKFERLLARIDELLNQGETVGLVGASAGAAATINAFAARKDKLVGAVCIAGKINRPQSINTLYYLNTPAMPEAVEACQQALASLTDQDRQRMLCRYGLIDETVTTSDSHIDGAHNQRFPTIGHFFNIAFQLTLGAGSLIRFLKRQAKSLPKPAN